MKRCCSSRSWPSNARNLSATSSFSICSRIAFSSPMSVAAASCVRSKRCCSQSSATASSAARLRKMSTASGANSASSDAFRMAFRSFREQAGMASILVPSQCLGPRELVGARLFVGDRPRQHQLAGSVGGDAIGQGDAGDASTAVLVGVPVRRPCASGNAVPDARPSSPSSAQRRRKRCSGPVATRAHPHRPQVWFHRQLPPNGSQLTASPPLWRPGVPSPQRPPWSRPQR